MKNKPKPITFMHPDYVGSDPAVPNSDKTVITEVKWIDPNKAYNNLKEALKNTDYRFDVQILGEFNPPPIKRPQGFDDKKYDRYCKLLAYGMSEDQAFAKIEGIIIPEEEE